LDPSADLLAIENVTEPSELRRALDVLAGFCRNGTLVRVDPAALTAAQRENAHVVEALCAVAGLSFRELSDRAAPASLPSSVTGPWTTAQLDAVFEIFDQIVRGSVKARIQGGTPARPVELLLPVAGAPDGWAAVEAFRTRGVPYEVLLAQRLVGSAWSAHRNSTAQVLPALIGDDVCAHLEAATISYWRLGRQNITKKFVAERIATGSDIGQVSIVAHADGRPLLAIAVSIATDGGTARKSGGKLEQLPAQLSVPAAVVLAGPGWAHRGESVGLVRAFAGRVFTDQTLDDLVGLPELVGSSHQDGHAESVASGRPETPKEKR
jgi:hypothetical protein